MLPPKKKGRRKKLLGKMLIDFSVSLKYFLLDFWKNEMCYESGYLIFFALVKLETNGNHEN